MKLVDISVVLFRHYYYIYFIRVEGERTKELEIGYDIISDNSVFLL